MQLPRIIETVQPDQGAMHAAWAGQPDPLDVSRDAVALMASPSPADALPVSSRNRFLATLPPDELALLARLGEPVRLAASQVLVRPGAPAEHVWFLDGAVAALSLDGEDEIDAVGRDGLVGTDALYGEPAALALVTVRIPGPALRVPVAAIRRAAADLPALHAAVARWTNGTLLRVARGASCARSHLLAARVAGQLLWLRDQSGADRLPLTHEQLAHQLGVSRRASITDALLALRARGGVLVRRGGITITSVESLLAAACPCYLDTRAQLDRRSPAPAVEVA